jgi:hypothetical protein
MSEQTNSTHSESELVTILTNTFAFGQLHSDSERAIRDAETRLLRFARTAAPRVRRSRIKRMMAFASVFVITSAGTAAAVVPHGIRIGGVEIFVDHPENPVDVPAPLEESIGSVSIVPVAPPVTIRPQSTVPSNASTWPGEPVTLEEANQRYKGRIRLPKALRAPKAIFWLEPPTSGQVTAVWSPTKKLPATSDRKVGLLLTQFRGTATSQPVVTKNVRGSQATIERVMVNKASATWITGPHVVTIVDDSGVRQENSRVAGNALIWAVGDFTYRLEANISKAEALRIARSVN